MHKKAELCEANELVANQKKVVSSHPRKNNERNV